jgi:hypothetical protein
MELFSCALGLSLLVYRKATDFFKLILYPTVLKLFMVSRRVFFKWSFLGLLAIRSCHLQIGIV